MKNIRATIVGASGYTGAELVRLLAQHPNVSLDYLVADSNAGKPITEIYPHFKGVDLPDLVKLDAVDWSNQQVAFCALPHATSQEVIKSLPKHVKVVDLSADFRITDAKVYEEWYGKPHDALELQKEAVYGLSEINGDKVKDARIVACPGCYPTSALLPLLPLTRDGVIDPKSVIIDAKSGITGAGRGAKVANLFAEANEDIRAYGVAGHRHVAEMEQELSNVSGSEVALTFTPQVIPVNRGILSVIYADLNEGKTIDDAKKALKAQYDGSAFVQVIDDGTVPTLRDVVYTNQSRMAIFKDRIGKRVIITSVIDNLIKGASGQAIQNFNLMFGFEETVGLNQLPIYP